MKPRVAVFSFTCCEGCSLQILNCEDYLPQLASAVDIVNFREAITERSDYYDIAFIDGACSTESEIERLEEIRQRANMVVPIGACACLGGVNCLKNSYQMEELLKTEYGEHYDKFNTIPARPVKAVIPIDFFIPLRLDDGGNDVIVFLHPSLTTSPLKLFPAACGYTFW